MENSGVTGRSPWPAVPGPVGDVMVHYVLICLGSRQAELLPSYPVLSGSCAPSSGLRGLTTTLVLMAQLKNACAETKNPMISLCLSVCCSGGCGQGPEMFTIFRIYTWPVEISSSFSVEICLWSAQRCCHHATKAVTTSLGCHL